jgi:transposase
MLLAERAESERLRQIIRELQRHRFGRRAESLPEEQLQFALEEAEQIEAAGFAKTEGPAERKARAAKRRANRGALPSHLPRIEMVVDVASTICPGCSGTLHRIGEDVSERLDIVPAQFRVLVVRRPKYACRTCEDLVVQASAPARLIEGGLPTEATIAQVLVSKYADHLPLYRQAQIYARQGVNLDRSTLADWVGRAAFLLRPVHQRLLDRLKASSKLFADETTAPVLDPGRGRTKTGQLFAYVSLKFDARRQTGGCPRRIELGRVAVADSHGKLGRRHERSHKLTIVETLSGSGMPVLSSFANCSGTTGRLK